MENQNTELRLQRAAELAVDAVLALDIARECVELSNALRSDLREVGFEEVRRLRRDMRSLVNVGA